jgi:geranylgeranyl reductase family protein
VSLDADVIIAGAGPGGASAAYFLGQAGCKVLVLEKAQLPRYKPCGGGVPNTVFNFFPFDFEPVIEQRISQATFVYGTRQFTQPVEADALTMVMRDQFDYHILQQAQAEVLPGIEVASVTQDAERVKVTTKQGQTFQAKYLIAADGANSPVARSVGLREGKELGVALELETEVDSATLAAYRERFLIGFGYLAAGYYWIFPKAHHLSIGIGTVKRGEKTMPQLLQEAMDNLGVSLEKNRRYAHPIPIRTRREQLQQGRILLVGDAAGLVDPLTGEGIRHAVESAHIAAQTIVAGNVAQYTRLIEKTYAGDLRWAGILSHIIYNTQQFSFDWIMRNRLAFTDLIRILSNRMSYRQFVGKLPLYVLSLGSRLPLDKAPLGRLY